MLHTDMSECFLIHPGLDGVTNPTDNLLNFHKLRFSLIGENKNKNKNKMS